MVRRIALLIISVFSLVQCNAQTDWFHYDWNAASPNEFAGMPEAAYNFDMKKYNENLYIGKYTKAFAEECAKELKDDISRGFFYRDIGNSNAYLRNILTSIVKDTAISNQIKIILTRDTDLNASMDESGVLRLNIGTLAILNNEAELAMLMGHEVGHFINEDAVKRYGRRIEQWGGAWNNFNLTELLFTNYNWNSREEESAADHYSIKLMKNSPYALKKGAEIFKEFKRLEIRCEIIYGRESVTFHPSHPDPGDRLKQVKFLSNDSVNIGKRAFVVDSVKFKQLKKLCFQETMNVALEQSELNLITRLSFKQYLFDPNDGNNLAILIESLRRLMVLKAADNVASKPFILYQYQTGHILGSDNYAFLNQPNPSMLKYLTKGFLDFGKDEYPSIKATDLLDTVNLKFTSNQEAFNYFTKKADEIGCKPCQMYKYINSSEDTALIKTFSESNNLFNVRDFLADQKNIPHFEKDMIVLMPMDLIKGTRAINRITTEESVKIHEAVMSKIKSATGSQMIMFDSLGFIDKHQLEALVDNAYTELKPKRNLGMQSDNKNWMETAPELYNFFKRNNIKNLYVCYASLDQSLSRKQAEIFAYYRISVPGQQRDSRNINVSTQHSTVFENTEEFYSDFANSFLSFFRVTKQ